MKKCILFFVLFACAARGQVSGNEASAPASPIAAVSYRGFTNAIALQNEFLRAVIVPQIGRLMEIELLDSESPLRADTMLDKGKSGETNSWPNYGGSWLWPAAQNRWQEQFGHNWPPPSFDEMDWTASAWHRADGSSFCRLQLDIGAPLHVRVTREFLLPKNSAKLQMSQRIDRVLESKMPVALWNVAQIGHADEVVMPLDAGANLVPMYDTHIDPKFITACSNAVVIDPREIGENKVGSTSPRSWIAGRKGNLVLILSAKPGDASGNFPEGGCRVQMFTSKPLGYSEIETLSEERALAPGETVANTVTMELFRAPAPVSGCALATWVEQLLGEIPFPPDVNETTAPGSKPP